MGAAGVSGRVALRNYALVCRAFNSPALDILWRHMDGLGPLLKLHPSCEVIDDSCVSMRIRIVDGPLFAHALNQYFLPQQIGSADEVKLANFYDHARRVRSLSLRPAVSPTATAPRYLCSHFRGLDSYATPRL